MAKCKNCGKIFNRWTGVSFRLCDTCFKKTHVKEWWGVSVGFANRLSFPDRCACCGGRAQSHVEAYYERSYGWPVRTTKTEGWPIPYCNFCQKHDLSHGRLIKWFAAAFLGYPFAIGVMLINDSMSLLERFVYISAMILVGLMIFYHAYVAFRRRKEGCTSKKNSDEGAVQFWHGQLRFRNQQYAKDFAALNGICVDNEGGK